MATSVMIVMVIAIILMVPVAVVYLPSLLVVVVVRMGPVGAGVRLLFPATLYPCVSSSVITPISPDPGVSFAW